MISLFLFVVFTLGNCLGSLPSNGVRTTNTTSLFARVADDSDRTCSPSVPDDIRFEKLWSFTFFVDLRSIHLSLRPGVTIVDNEGCWTRDYKLRTKTSCKKMRRSSSNSFGDVYLSHRISLPFDAYRHYTFRFFFKLRDCPSTFKYEIDYIHQPAFGPNKNIIQCEKIFTEVDSGFNEISRRCHSKVADTEEEGVYLFSDASYRGRELKFTAAEELNDGKHYEKYVGRSVNDKISSIVINGNYEVHLFQHDRYEGKRIVLDRSYFNLHELGFGDRVSSLIIREKREGVFLYEHSYYRGKELELRKGHKLPNLKHNRFNDRLSSVRIVGDHKLKLCTDANLGGYCWTIADNLPILGKKLNDEVSYVEVL